jgi:FAD:protein FMN transferase
MKRRAFLQVGLGLGAALAAGAGVAGMPPAPVPERLVWRSRSLNAMGTSMRLQLAHADAARAEQALEAAIAEIREVEDQMSLFREGSALCQLNRSGHLDHPPAALREILRTAQQVAQRSQGAFDVTVQPLWLAFEGARQPTRARPAAERRRRAPAAPRHGHHPQRHCPGLCR